MCTYLASGPNSLRKAVWMYPGCLHPTVEAGAPASFQKGFKSTQKLQIQQEKRSNVAQIEVSARGGIPKFLTSDSSGGRTYMRHSPHMSDFSYVRVMAREVFQSDSSSHFHAIMGLASFSLYPLVHVTVICGTKTAKTWFKVSFSFHNVRLVCTLHEIQIQVSDPLGLKRTVPTLQSLLLGHCTCKLYKTISNSKMTYKRCLGDIRLCTHSS